MFHKALRALSALALVIAIGFSIYWAVRGEWPQVIGGGTIAIVMLLPIVFPNARIGRSSQRDID